MNCNKPAAITFSFEGFCRRGGLTGEHADGWGIAFFEDRGCRLFIDDAASCASPLAQMIRSYPIKSRNVIAHIRKATQGGVSLRNCHPFQRELWGRHWIFAHNGDLKEFQPRLSGFYTPVGDTDSERAFCYLMQQLRARFGDTPPELHRLYEALAEFSPTVARYGVFNYMLSNGDALFVYCSTNLHYVVRQSPFASARLVDCDLSIDFNQYNHLDDRICVIATQPLTCDENWHALAPGDLRVFVDGQPMQ